MGSDIQAGEDFGIIIQQPQSCTVIRERETQLIYFTRINNKLKTNESLFLIIL